MVFDMLCALLLLYQSIHFKVQEKKECIILLFILAIVIRIYKIRTVHIHMYR